MTNEKKRYEPFPQQRFSDEQLRKIFTDGRLASEFMKEDEAGYRAARLEAQQAGILGENLNRHIPAPKTPPAPAAAEPGVFLQKKPAPSLISQRTSLEPPLVRSPLKTRCCSRFTEGQL